MPAPDSSSVVSLPMTEASVAEVRAALREHLRFCAASLAENLECGEHEDAETFASRVEVAIDALRQVGWTKAAPAGRAVA